jgi:flavin-dependent dehydrogenase
VSDQLSPGKAFDVVVVGSGIGGLSCGALLAYYGFKVGLGHTSVVVRGATLGSPNQCWMGKRQQFSRAEGWPQLWGLLAYYGLKVGLAC